MVKHNYPPAALGPAEDHQELRNMMNMNNARHKKAFHYFDFHVFKGKLFCMYEISEMELTDKVTSDDKDIR